MLLKPKIYAAMHIVSMCKGYPNLMQSILTMQQPISSLTSYNCVRTSTTACILPDILQEDRQEEIITCQGLSEKRVINSYKSRVKATDLLQ